ncbi:uncharacterized protein LOC122320749 [Drosophila ficusphila]|uniref:uncharacterized protein LOC122320749 n=1 Tax=Drosophila ficusphila TaxID=30025 RepID=UPI001C8A699E|nr:uncharacterized protein LOC122320749 [Drosophila ficusphila]
MKGVDPRKYSVEQLKNWLGHLKLSTKGPKTTLVARINRVPISIRGSQPPLVVKLLQEEQRKEAEQKMEEQSENFTTGDDQAPTCSNAKNNDASNNEIWTCEELRASKMENEQIEADEVGSQNDELQKLKKKMEQLLEENEGLKNTEKEREPVGAGNKESMMLMSASSVSLNIIKDMLPEFGNKSPVNIWVAQLKTVAEIHNLDDNMLRLLIMTKLKGEALTWLYDTNDRLSFSINEILNQMMAKFGTKQNKMCLRRQFEKRNWLVEENFAAYYHQKISLASQIQLDEEELLDNIIEGIPDDHLRQQAHMQCFKQPAQMLKAFEKITLPKKATTSVNLEKAKGDGQRLKAAIRCYNCNSLGHVAAECRKPKREYGACYGCGSLDHRIATCDQKKKSTNEFRVSSIQGARSAS